MEAVKKQTAEAKLVAAPVPAKQAKTSSLNSIQKKALETKVQHLDEQISRFNHELAAVATRLESASMYEEKNKAELKDLLKLQSTTQKNLEVAEAEWLNLNEQLEG